MNHSLFEQLENYNQMDYYPFHMPGHKRNSEIKGFPVGIDITEIEGFDNLHHASSVLLEAQQKAAALYGAEESFFLVSCLQLVLLFPATVRSFWPEIVIKRLTMEYF